MSADDMAAMILIQEKIRADYTRYGYTPQSPLWWTRYVSQAKPSITQSPTNYVEMRSGLNSIMSEKDLEKMRKIQAMLVERNILLSWNSVLTELPSQDTSTALSWFFTKPFNRILSIEFMLKWSWHSLFNWNNLSFFSQLNDMIDGETTSQQKQTLTTVLRSLQAYDNTTLQQLDLWRDEIVMVIEFLLAQEELQSVTKKLPTEAEAVSSVINSIIWSLDLEMEI